MKKTKKLSLKELNVKSFVTSQAAEIVGGTNQSVQFVCLSEGTVCLSDMGLCETQTCASDFQCESMYIVCEQL